MVIIHLGEINCFWVRSFSSISLKTFISIRPKGLFVYFFFAGVFFYKQDFTLEGVSSLNIYRTSLDL